MQFLFAAIAAIVISVGLALAEDLSDCKWKNNSDTRIAVCSRLIASFGTSSVGGNDLSELYVGRGDAYAAKGDLERAIADYNEAARMDRKYPAEVLHRRGEVYRKKGDSVRADRDADEVIRLADTALQGTLPDYSRAYWLSTRAQAKFAKGNREQAFQDIDEAIRRQPDNSSSRIVRGHFNMQSRRFERAIQDYDETLRLSPNFLAAYVQRGLAHKEQGNSEAAMRDLDEAVRRNPNAAFVFFHRGSVLLDAGRREEAKVDLRKALDLEPHLTEARTLLSKAEASPLGYKLNTKSPEFILLAMGIVGIVYVLGQLVKGKLETKSIGRQILVGCAVAITSGVVLKLLDVAGGEQLVVITIAGLLVIAVSIFA
jgi:tetratricopeptide (TPR) repeat protein